MDYLFETVFYSQVALTVFHEKEYFMLLVDYDPTIFVQLISCKNSKCQRSCTHKKGSHLSTSFKRQAIIENIYPKWQVVGSNPNPHGYKVNIWNQNMFHQKTHQFNWWSSTNIKLTLLEYYWQLGQYCCHLYIL